MKSLLTILFSVLVGGVLCGAEQQPSSENTWGEQVSGLRMRLATAASDDKLASHPHLALELQNISDSPFRPERLADICHIEPTKLSGERLIVREGISPPGPWTTRKAAIQPGEILRWSERNDRFGVVWPSATDHRVRIRFGISLRHTGADNPQLVVYTNWLTLPTPNPKKITSEKDLPTVWGTNVDLVYLHNPGGLSPLRRLHIDGEGRARLVRPAWGHEDKAVPYGRYETRLAKEQLNGLLKLFREQRIWDVEDKAVRPPSTDGGELDFSLVVGGGSLARRYSAEMVAKHTQLKALEKEMERLMATVVEQAKKDGMAFPATR